MPIVRIASTKKVNIPTNGEMRSAIKADPHLKAQPVRTTHAKHGLSIPSRLWFQFRVTARLQPQILGADWHESKYKVAVWRLDCLAPTLLQDMVPHLPRRLRLCSQVPT